MIGLDSFSKQRLIYLTPVWIIPIFVSTTHLKVVNYSNSLCLHAVAESIGPLKRLK